METKTFTRKSLRVKAMLTMSGSSPVMAHTFDIGTSGISLNCTDSIQEGREGQVAFQISLNGNLRDIVAQVKVVDCIFSNGGFKSRMRFNALPPQTMRTIQDYME
ncbi:PilZ domain-containing protein [Herbaspirillum sp. RTI4]|uniref:PilZ domain-containing protein n=1 Tax=Herbaspirillum sp. RTI4 TaxID=3048640 RepID=UPI002AB422D0|nr:PilZ domain-containing protein [Herbaspirillum sp. RTI4]MDY7577998.1 PilZ domain-containing protein [Herbaspirillum sp. RTI4]MEA9982072.1 PilZ domain-containing protein [Herbaspirillum sp. RTI4]